MKEIAAYKEVVDRLLDSNFNFRIEDGKLFIHSYSTKGAASYSALGFYYFGDADEYFYDLESNHVELQFVIANAFSAYKHYAETYIQDTIYNMLEGLK